MDLRKYKYISNTKHMPQYADGKFGNTMMQVIPQSFDFIGSSMDALGGYKYNATDVINQGGNIGTSNINGINYQDINLSNTALLLNNLKSSNTLSTLGMAATGAQLGATLGGPWGAAAGGAIGLIGGIFGGKSKKRALKNAIQEASYKTDNMNTDNRSIADSTYLLLLYSKKYGNQSNDQLWYGRKGKVGELHDNGGISSNKKLVVTPIGKKTTYANAMLAPGEVLRLNGNVQVVSPLKVKRSFSTGKDTEPAMTNEQSINANNPGNVVPAPQDNSLVFGLSPASIIGSNKTYAEYANEAGAARLQLILDNGRNVGKYGKLSSLSKTTKDFYETNAKPILDEINQKLDKLAELLSMQHNVEQNMKTNKYNCGKMPGYENGKMPFGSLLPYMIESGMSIGDYLTHSKATVNVPDTYVDNPYANYASNQLLSLKDNPDKYMNAINDQYKYGLYDLLNAGGLTPGQRMLLKLSLVLGTLKNKASTLMDLKNKNDQLLQNAYNMMQQTGEASAQRRLNANQLLYENTARAYAAKNNLMSADKSNFIKSLLGAAKNYNDWNMYQNTLNLYQLQNEINKQNADTLRKLLMGNNPTVNPIPVVTPSANTYNYDKPFPWVTDPNLRKYFN